MHWIDSHAHLSDAAFSEDREAVIGRAWEAGVSDILNICTDAETLAIGQELARQHARIHLVASTTPHDVVEEDPFFDRVAAAAKEGQLVAIGETGLEYHHEVSPKSLQRVWCERYLHLASQCRLPVVLHCRDGFSDLFALLDAIPSLQGVFHCFTGTLDEAKGVIDRGFYLSMSGIVTFKPSHALREVAQWVPLDRLLVETDAPYLAPQSRRGKRNEPAFVTETGRLIGGVRGISEEAIAEATAANARRLFNLSSPL